MIKEHGKTYILPVRLDGFNGEVPGMSGSISYLAVSSNHPEIIIDAFIRKIGRKSKQSQTPQPKKETFKPSIPKLKKTFTDKEKNHFLKSSFQEIVNLIDDFASATQKEYPHFDHEMEMLTTRKAFFTLYENERQVSQFKIWLGGIIGGNSICFYHGQDIDTGNDGSMNESISMEEHEGELKLKPMGMGMLGMNKDTPMSPREVADYLWKMVFKHLAWRVS
jgi:hypothetical protein